jgi:hypothetical protein
MEKKSGNYASLSIKNKRKFKRKGKDNRKRIINPLKNRENLAKPQ